MLVAHLKTKVCPSGHGNSVKSNTSRNISCRDSINNSAYMTLNDRIKTLPPEQHQLFLELSTADLDVVSPASFLTAMGEVNEALRDRGYETLAAQQLSYFVQSQIETAQILIDLTNRQTAEALQQRVAFFAEPRTQQKPIDVNIHQTLQWFLEIPEDHPDVIVIHGQKFLILEGIESEPGNSRNYFCLLSVENSLFKKTTIINRHSRAHSKLFEEVQRYAREKYASFESDKPFKESKYQDKVVRAFDSFQEVNATNIFVPSGQVDLSGSRLVLTDDEGTVFSHVLNYENIGYGTPNYLQTDYGI